MPARVASFSHPMAAISIIGHLAVTIIVLLVSQQANAGYPRTLDYYNIDSSALSAAKLSQLDQFARQQAEPSENLSFLYEQLAGRNQLAAEEDVALAELARASLATDYSALEPIEFGARRAGANPLAGDDISAPANDPADFEANANASEWSFSPLDGQGASDSASKLASYLDSLLQAAGARPSNSSELSESKSIDRASKTAATSARSDSSASPSRYGSAEYIDHPLALAGHQYVQGGAGEGKQLLGPDGIFENVQVIKSDHAVPAYCDPPNPCPIGYTAEDGCLEQFVNSAGFSREYQAKQQCSCDDEHSLFNCAASIAAVQGQVFTGSPQADNTIDSPANNPSGRPLSASQSATKNDQDEDSTENSLTSKLDTLARAIQNRFGSLLAIRNLIADERAAEHEHQEMSAGAYPM